MRRAAYAASVVMICMCGLAYAQLPPWYHSQRPLNGPGGWAVFGELGNPPYPNHWCSDAALQMVFAFFEGNVKANANPPRYPQREIRAVANTDDWQGAGAWTGTFITDLRRAAHFSSQSFVSTNDSSLQYWNGSGYSWRQAINGVKPGYSACEDNWKQQGWNFMQLVALIYGVPYNPDAPDSLGEIPDSSALRYPLILFLNTDSLNAYLHSGAIYFIESPDTIEDTLTHNTEGHAVVLYQYWFGPKWVFVLDPALGLWRCSRNLFWNSLWQGDFLFAAPWELAIGTMPPSVVKKGSQFSIVVGPTYTGPPPLSTLSNQPRYPLSQSSATISLPAGLSLPNNDPTHNLIAWLNSLSDNFNGQNATSWNINANQVGSYTITVSAQGTLQSLSSHSYNSYTDVIGLFQSTYNVTVISGTIVIIRRPCRSWYEPPFWPWVCSWSFNQDTLFLFAKNPGDDPATDVTIHVLLSDPTTVLNVSDTSTWAPYMDTLITYIAPGDSSIIPVPYPAGPNAYGQPYWSFIAWVDDGSEDTLSSSWLFEEDGRISSKNLVFTEEVVPGEPVYFRVSNPDTLPLLVRNGVDLTGLPPGWNGYVEPDSVLLLPNESADCMLVIDAPNPVPPEDSIAYVHVTTAYFNPDPEFYRFAGGFTWWYKYTPPVKVEGEPSPVVANGIRICGSSVWMDFSGERSVEISVYNLAGRRVFHTGKQHYGSGRHVWNWRHTDFRNHLVPPGIYYIVVKSGERRITSPVVVIR